MTRCKTGWLSPNPDLFFFRLSLLLSFFLSLSLLPSPSLSLSLYFHPWLPVVFRYPHPYGSALWCLSQIRVYVGRSVAVTFLSASMGVRTHIIIIIIFCMNAGGINLKWQITSHLGWRQPEMCRCFRQEVVFFVFCFFLSRRSRRCVRPRWHQLLAGLKGTAVSGSDDARQPSAHGDGWLRLLPFYGTCGRHARRWNMQQEELKAYFTVGAEVTSSLLLGIFFFFCGGSGYS